MDRIEAQVLALCLGGIELDLAVVDDSAAVIQLLEMAEVRGPTAMIAVAGERLVIERDEDVGLVAIGADVLVVHAHSVERVLAHDVRVVFDVRVDTKACSGAGLCEYLGGGIDTAALGTADHPGQPILLHAEHLFYP